MGGKALGAFTAFIWGGAGAALGGIPGAMVGGIAGQAYGDYWGGKIGGKIALRIYDHRMAHK
jgi:hypothetical protein